MRSEVIVQSPGRINIIGEHTDYNDGYVLPAAIDKNTVFNIKRNGTEKSVSFKADNVEQDFTFDLDSFVPINGSWQNYVMGVVHEMQQLGAKFRGFDASFNGDVPIGAGMSSSAALECSLAFGLNELFHTRLDKWQLIKACQMAEHNFVGIKCGIMDQFASVMGKPGHVILLDCRSLEFKYFPFDIGEYQLVLMNTNVSHSLASSEYNNRRSECNAAVDFICKDHHHVTSLRDVSYDMLRNYKNSMPVILYKRIHHVVTENNRVLEATTALGNGDISALGALMYQSHDSLKNHYEVSCIELDTLIDISKDMDYVLGARMMGGGFGGCTINVVKKDRAQEFLMKSQDLFKKKFNSEASPYFVNIEQGTTLIS